MKLFTSHKPSFDDCPTGLKENLVSWKNKNPSFEFEYFDDAKMIDWMQRNTSEENMKCFHLLNTGAGRADLYRIRKLFVEGGIWFDADLPAVDILEKVPNLKELMAVHKTTFFTTRKSNEPRFMIMASKSGNNIFQEFEDITCKEILRLSKTNEVTETINLTGPKAFHKCLCKYLGFKQISELKIGQTFSQGNISFIFLEDVLDYSKDGGAIIKYKSYRRELECMDVIHHKHENAVKQNLL
jgi:hypothetical protein